MSRLLLSAVFAAILPPASAQEKTTWQDHVRPVFENRCTNCHNPDKKKGDLDLSTYAGAMAGGSGGASVEAGDALGSTLWKVISHLAEPPMPPKGDKIPQPEIDIIGKWITGGLLETAGGSAKVKKKAAFAMTASASAARPAGAPPMPEHLLLEPVVAPARPNAILALAHSPWAPLAALTAPRQVLLYHSTTGELLGVLPFPDGGTPETLSFSRNGALLLAGGGIAGKQGTVIVWDVKTGQPVINLSMNEDFDTILAADISADLSKVAMGGPGRRVRIYDTRTSTLLANIKKHTDWVTALSFSPDGVLLATGDRNGGLYIWESDTGNEFQTFRAHEKMISSLAWRADSNLLAAGSEDGSLTWWEMINGTQVKKINSHGGVLALGFAPDGRSVSGGRDGHVRVWDGHGAQKRDWVPSGGSPVLETIFSEDGKRILSGSWNGEVKSWDAADEKAPPALLVANPPSISARLAALEAALALEKLAIDQAAASMTEQQKSAEAAEAATTALKASSISLQKTYQSAGTQLEQIQKAATKMQEIQSKWMNSLATAEKAWNAAPPAISEPVAADMPDNVKAALEQATASVLTVDKISHTLTGKKIAKLKELIRTSEPVLRQRQAQIEKTSQETTAIKESLASVNQQIGDKEKALTAARDQSAAALREWESRKTKAALTSREIARWQAARQQTAALALRAESNKLKEKLESLQNELAPLEATASAIASGPPPPRLIEIKKLLEALPEEAATKEKAASTAWQSYLDLLPK